jgi:serine/threonine protein kinase, bacterial
VYLAERPRIPSRVALKILRADVSADREFRDRFSREVDLAVALDHPHMARVFDRGESDRRLWLAAEFIDALDTGRSLRERYPAGMPSGAVLIVVDRIAGALDFAHQRGLVHRHVKPANILLDNPDSDAYRILLTDFGTARAIDNLAVLSSATRAAGLLGYAAPEQFTRKDVDGRADQYGLAATAFHLFSGSPPIAPVLNDERQPSIPPPTVADTRPSLRVLTRSWAGLSPTIQAPVSAPAGTSRPRSPRRVPPAVPPPRLV